MAVYNNIGDTIEGEAIDVDGRAVYQQGLKKHPKTNKTMKLFTTDRNSHAVVTTDGKVPEAEPLRSQTADFHRAVGDKVTGDALSIYADIKASVKFETLHGNEGATHRHGNQFASIRKHAIATVKVPLQNILKKLGYTQKSITDKTD